MFARLKRFLVLAAIAVFATGCATSNNPADPLEGFNRAMFSLNDGLDKAVVKPIATGYATVVPQPARNCVSNVFANVNDIFVGINSLLQGKVGDAVSDACRVLINTTIGLGGCFDVASKAGFEKHNRDFGQTFGKWGIGSGPYVVLPFFGPSSFRDTVGTVIYSYLDPVWVNHVRTRNVLVGVRALNRRAELLTASTVLEEAALDKYAFVRDTYLQRRESMIKDDANKAGEKKSELDAPLPLAHRDAVAPMVLPEALLLDDANQRAGQGVNQVELNRSAQGVVQVLAANPSGVAALR